MYIHKSHIPDWENIADKISYDSVFGEIFRLCYDSFEDEHSGKISYQCIHTELRDNELIELITKSMLPALINRMDKYAEDEAAKE